MNNDNSNGRSANASVVSGWLPYIKERCAPLEVRCTREVASTPEGIFIARHREESHVDSYQIGHQRCAHRRDLRPNDSRVDW